MKKGEIINENSIVLPVPGSHVVAAGIGGKERIMNEKDLNYIIKCFYEEKTNKTYRTLSKAKKSTKFPYVYRAWLQNGKILDKEPIFCYGSSVCTIKRADEEIYKRLIK